MSSLWHTAARNLLVAAVISLASPGCVPGAGGPTSSMAPFVHLEPEGRPVAEESGKVATSIGVSRQGDLTMYPHGTGSVSWWAAEFYDLAFLGSNVGVFAQGLWVLADGQLGRIGLVHGTGLGWDWTDRPLGLLTAGLFGQGAEGPYGAPYGGIRYVHGFGGDLSAGWMLRSGALQFGPEVSLMVFPMDFPPYGASATFQMEAVF